MAVPGEETLFIEFLGTNRGFTQINSDNVSECRTLCVDDATCKGYTFLYNSQFCFHYLNSITSIINGNWSNSNQADTLSCFKKSTFHVNTTPDPTTNNNNCDLTKYGPQVLTGLVIIVFLMYIKISLM